MTPICFLIAGYFICGQSENWSNGATKTNISEATAGMRFCIRRWWRVAGRDELTFYFDRVIIEQRTKKKKIAHLGLRLLHRAGMNLAFIVICQVGDTTRAIYLATSLRRKL